jgi:exonuclease SbcC
LIRRRNDAFWLKKIVEQNRATNQIILDGLQFDLMLWKTQNKVTDLESIEKILELQLDLAVIDEKKKADVIFFRNRKEKKNTKRVDKTSS